MTEVLYSVFQRSKSLEFFLFIITINGGFAPIMPCDGHFWLNEPTVKASGTQNTRETWSARITYITALDKVITSNVSCKIWINWTRSYNYVTCRKEFPSTATQLLTLTFAFCACPDQVFFTGDKELPFNITRTAFILQRCPNGKLRCIHWTCRPGEGKPLWGLTLTLRSTSQQR